MVDPVPNFSRKQLAHVATIRAQLIGDQLPACYRVLFPGQDAAALQDEYYGLMWHVEHAALPGLEGEQNLQERRALTATVLAEVKLVL